MSVSFGIAAYIFLGLVHGIAFTYMDIEREEYQRSRHPEDLPDTEKLITIAALLVVVLWGPVLLFAVVGVPVLFLFNKISGK